MDGKVNWFDGVDSDGFSIHELSEMLKLLGYKNETMFYHFKIPNSGLDLGLKPLVSDSDVIEMVKQVGSIKVIKVYTEPWLSAIDYDHMSNPENMSKIDIDVPKPMSNPLPKKKKGVATKPKMKVESDIHNDQIEIIHMQTKVGKEHGVDDVQIGNEQDNEHRVVFEKGESSMPNIGEDKDVMVDEDNIIYDVQVDMGDFRMKYNMNWEAFTQHQVENNDKFEDEELDLED
ncbi:hypothetical protein Tco_1182921 [Tanacetum coccineum]